MKSSTERSGEGARKDIGQEVLRLSLALKAMGGGVWDFDAGSGALYCNERCYQIMGIDPENQKISSMSDLKKSSTLMMFKEQQK